MRQRRTRYPELRGYSNRARREFLSRARAAAAYEGGFIFKAALVGVLAVWTICWALTFVSVPLPLSSAVGIGIMGALQLTIIESRKKKSLRANVSRWAAELGLAGPHDPS